MRKPPLPPGATAVVPVATGTGAAPAAASPRPAPRAYHHGNLRDALVSRGVEILETGGAAALSLRQAARDVGVSQTAPLHHFDGKIGYLAAIAAQGFRMLFEARVRGLQGAQSPADRLLAVMLAHLRFAVEHPALFHVMYGPEIPDKALFPELEQAAARSFGVLEACVGDYLAHRQVPLARTRAASLAAWTACHGLATILAERQNAWGILRKDPMRTGRDVFAIFIAGLDHVSAAPP